MRHTAAESAETRQAIVRSALRRFAQDGWEACSLAEVARGANVTRGAVYHHFTGKRDLLDAVLSEHWNSQGETLLGVLDTDFPPPIRLTKFLADYLHRLGRDPRFRELAVVTVLVAPQAPAVNPGMERKTEVLAHWSERVAEVLAECEQQLTAPLETAHFIISSFLYGATITAALTPAELPNPEFCQVAARSLVAGIYGCALISGTEGE